MSKSTIDKDILELIKEKMPSAAFDAFKERMNTVEELESRVEEQEITNDRLRDENVDLQARAERKKKLDEVIEHMNTMEAQIDGIVLGLKNRSKIRMMKEPI